MWDTPDSLSQGEVGDRFYIITKGQAVITKKVDGEDKVRSGKVHPTPHGAAPHTAALQDAAALHSIVPHAPTYPSPT